MTILLCTAVSAQRRNIVGTVTDMSDGSPIVGAGVVVKDASGKIMTGATTDLQGQYTVSAGKDAATIEFSMLGMSSISMKIGSKDVIDAQLEMVSSTLDEVVVTALGMKRETRALNYSRQSVNAASVMENKTPDFVTSLQGRVAGLQVSTAGQNTGSSGIVIRGYSSATGDNNVIFVVDGVIMENGAVGGESGGLDYGNAMGVINP